MLLDTQKVVGATRRLVAMKNLTSKRFSEEVKQSTTDGLMVLQGRVERASAQFNSLRKSVPERYFSEDGGAGPRHGRPPPPLPPPQQQDGGAAAAAAMAAAAAAAAMAAAAQQQQGQGAMGGGADLPGGEEGFDEDGSARNGKRFKGNGKGGKPPRLPAPTTSQTWRNWSYDRNRQ